MVDSLFFDLDVHVDVLDELNWAVALCGSRIAPVLKRAFLLGRPSGLYHDYSVFITGYSLTAD